MWADFHIHTYWSRDSMSRPKDILKASSKKGLKVIAITDHNEIEGALEMIKEAKLSDIDITVIVGEEVKTSRGDIIGLFLTEKIKKGLSPEETIDLIKEQGGITTIPHPFDRKRRGALGEYTKKIIHKVDFIEVENGRTPSWNNRKAKIFSEKSGIPGIGGSDAHWFREVGKVRTMVKQLRNSKIEIGEIRREEWPPIIAGVIYSSISKAYNFFIHHQPQALLQAHS